MPKICKFCAIQSDSYLFQFQCVTFCFIIEVFYWSSILLLYKYDITVAAT